MSKKYLRFPVPRTAVDSGTTSANGITAGTLTQSGQNFTSTVSVGDIVVDTANNLVRTVLAVTSDTELLVGSTGEGIDTGATFVIYDVDSIVDEIVPVSETLSVVAVSGGATQTAINLSSGVSGFQKITLTHGAGLSTYSVQDEIASRILTFLKTKWHEVDQPANLSVTVGAIAWS